MEDSTLSESCSLTYDVVDDSDHSADDIISATGSGTGLLVVGDIMSANDCGTGLLFDTGVDTVG